MLTNLFRYLFLAGYFLINIKVSTAITVGAKSFTEGQVLGEILAQYIEQISDIKVKRKYGLGGTGIAYSAIKNRNIDLYIEYTGTIKENIINSSDPHLTVNELRKKLFDLDSIHIGPDLGLDNTYALAVTKQTASKYNLTKISDLQKVPHFRLGITHEFIERKDGLKTLFKFYNLSFDHLESMLHSLSYQAIINNKVDLIDVYSTDAQIEKYNLQLLEDDAHFFPPYRAVILATDQFTKKYPKIWNNIIQLEGKINTSTMANLNAQVTFKNQSFEEVAQNFLKETFKNDSRFQLSRYHPKKERSIFKIPKFWEMTKRHLFLVFNAVFFSALIAIPMGIWAAHNRFIAQILFVFSGLVQTIPTLALLCFLIPFFGIGTVPAFITLLLYGLLPILRATHAGLISIEERLIEVSKVLGLNFWQRIWKIELPLAQKSIMAGIKTSAIISVGTATLAAFIGAGGYGDPIVTGLALNDTTTILHGAIPAAGMALVFHIIFELGEKKF